MSAVEDFTLHSLPVVLMLAMLAFNHLITHQRAERRYALEAFRLRSALSSELRALRDNYETNLDLLARGEGYLMSVRSPLQIYRSNLGRMTALFEIELVDELVSLFARNEFIEALIAAHATSKGGISYLLTEKSRLEELKQAFAAGVEQIARTREILDRARNRPSPDFMSSVRSRQQPNAATALGRGSVR